MPAHPAFAAPVVAAASTMLLLASGHAPSHAAEPTPTNPTPGQAPPPAQAEAIHPIAMRVAAEVSRDRLMADVARLPIARSSDGDAAHRQGLRDTEALLEGILTEMGYHVVKEPFRWVSPLERLRRRDRQTTTTNANPAANPDADPAANPAATPPATPASDDTPVIDPSPAVGGPDQEPPWHNLIIEHRGADLPQEVIIIGAHFDAVTNSPGADDNATGVAALLELARRLEGVRTRRTIRMAFFNLEEVGIVGATRHFSAWAAEQDQRPPDQRETIVGMVSMDMLGFFSDEPGSQRSPVPSIPGVFEAPTVGDSIAVVGVAAGQPFSRPFAEMMRQAAPGLKVTSFDFSPVIMRDIARSDHRPWMMSGLPGVMLTDTANFRNPHYHQPTDTIDTLDPHRFTLVARGVVGATIHLAQPIDQPANDADSNSRQRP